MAGAKAGRGRVRNKLLPKQAVGRRGSTVSTGVHHLPVQVRGKTANLSGRGRDYLGPRRGRVSVSFPENLIGLGRLRERGRGLIPPGASHVGRPAAPRKGHALVPQCTAGRVIRSGRSQLDRYGLAPPSLRFFPLGVAQNPGGPLPSISPPPARPRPLPAYLQTDSRAGTEPVPWGREPGVVGTTEHGRRGIAGAWAPSTCGVFGAAWAAVAPRPTFHGYGIAGAGRPSLGMV